MLAEVGIVALGGVFLALIGFPPASEASLGMQMAFGIGGCLAGWAVMRGLALIGAASARMLGLDELWGYAFAIPVGSVVITWASSSLPIAAAKGEREARCRRRAVTRRAKVHPL